MDLKARLAAVQALPSRWTTPTLARVRAGLVVIVVVLIAVYFVLGDPPRESLLSAAGISLCLLHPVHKTYRARFPAEPPATRVPDSRL